MRILDLEIQTGIALWLPGFQSHSAVRGAGLAKPSFAGWMTQRLTSATRADLNSFRSCLLLGITNVSLAPAAARAVLAVLCEMKKLSLDEQNTG